MPILRIQVNQSINDETKKRLLTEASKIICSVLKKPEYYMMVSIEQEATMMFGGTTAPLAYLELKSLGLLKSHIITLSETLCHFLTRTLGIPTERIYIEFTNLEGSTLGWNATTL